MDADKLAAAQADGHPSGASGLLVKMLAGSDDLAREVRYEPTTGERYLANPVDGSPRPYPLAGVVFLDIDLKTPVDPPRTFVMPTDYPSKQLWIELVDVEPVVRAAGSVDNPWSSTHTFMHAGSIVLHTGEEGHGDLTYRVTHQPDKYDDETGEPCGPERAGDPTTHVDWFYVAELVEA